MRLFAPPVLMAPALRAGHLAARPGGGAGAAPAVTGAVRVRPPGIRAAAATKPDAVAPARAPDMSAGAPAAEPSAAPPETGTLPQKAVAPPPPGPVKSPGRIARSKSGGRSARAGGSTTCTCPPATRGGGKTCRRQTGCPVLCQARSRSFWRIRPVPGCKAILTRDGPGMTQCAQ
jgi:hypothetical protein